MPDLNPNTTPSAATIGYGALFSIGVVAGNATTWTDVAEVKSLKPSGISIGTVESSHLRSPNNFKEKKPGQGDNGTIEITGNYIADTSQDLIESMTAGRVIFAWRYKSVAGGTPGTAPGKIRARTGFGFFTKFTPGDIEADKDVEFSATLEVTSIEAFTDDTASTQIAAS